MTSSPSGHSAVRAMKKPQRLSAGTAWENLELFPTPPWATRALFAHVLPMIWPPVEKAWDPCAGLGHMSAVLTEFCRDVCASDVHIYDMAPIAPGSTPKSSDFGVRQADFLDRDGMRIGAPYWIITNPPFSPAVDMLERALSLPGCVGVALLLRMQWLTTEGRYERVFLRRPPTLVAPFVERVAMCLGGLDLKGSTATDYAWFVWRRRDHTGDWERPPLSPGGVYMQLIPPCKDALQRPIDRALARRCVPGFVPPSLVKKQSKAQASFVE